MSWISRSGAIDVTGALLETPIIYANQLGWRNRFGRVVWVIAYTLLYRPSPVFFFGWRNWLLRRFGASIGPGVKLYPKCRIWAPWNLQMAAGSCMADDVDCYSVDKVTLAANSLVSQQAFLCTASHDTARQDFALITRPITIGANAWVAARAFVGPGVSIGEGAVVGATASVFRDVAPWTVVGGNPAREIGRRVVQA